MIEKLKFKPVKIEGFFLIPSIQVDGKKLSFFFLNFKISNTETEKKGTTPNLESQNQTENISKAVKSIQIILKQYGIEKKPDKNLLHYLDSNPFLKEQLFKPIDEIHPYIKKLIVEHSKIYF